MTGYGSSVNLVVSTFIGGKRVQHYWNSILDGTRGWMAAFSGGFRKLPYPNIPLFAYWHGIVCINLICPRHYPVSFSLTLHSSGVPFIARGSFRLLCPHRKAPAFIFSDWIAGHRFSTIIAFSSLSPTKLNSSAQHCCCGHTSATEFGFGADISFP